MTLEIWGSFRFLVLLRVPKRICDYCHILHMKAGQLQLVSAPWLGFRELSPRAS